MASEQSQTPEVSFSSLVLTLSTSAWVALGKIADPISGEVKTDLPGARYTIDLLVMLRDKTRGNLSADEDKFLNTVVGELQGNYAEAVFSGKQKQAVGDQTAPENGPQTQAPREQADNITNNKDQG